jgi:hypothetical protein
MTGVVNLGNGEYPGATSWRMVYERPSRDLL